MAKEKHEEIEDFIEESPEYSSMSHFVRAVGLREARGMARTTGGEMEAPEDLQEDIGELKDEMRTLKEGMSDLREMFDTVVVQTTQPDENIARLQEDLFDLLPDGEATEIAESAVEADVSVTGRFQNEYRYVDDRPTPGWPEDLTDAVDAARKVDVVEALDRMSDDLGVVERTEIGGDPWFYKEV